MDYIMFGIGTGSSLLLIGWLLRDLGPALRDRRPRAASEVLGAQQLVDMMRWARFCAACGGALAMGGALLLLVTVIALLVSPSDAGGARIVVVTFTIVAVAMLVWAWLFVSRFGIAGIYRARPAAPRTVTAPDAPAVPVDDGPDHEEDLADATSGVTVVPDLDAPAPAPDPAASPSPPETDLAAPADDPEAPSIAAPESRPDEFPRDRIESPAVDGVVAGYDGDAAIGADAGDQSTVDPALALPADPARSSHDGIQEPGTGSQADQDPVEPVIDGAERDEDTVLTVAPAAEREAEKVTPLDPDSIERSGETDATPVAADPDDAGGAEDGVVEGPAPMGRVEALRRLRQRRLR